MVVSVVFSCTLSEVIVNVSGKPFIVVTSVEVIFSVFEAVVSVTVIVVFIMFLVVVIVVVGVVIVLVVVFIIIVLVVYVVVFFVVLVSTVVVVDVVILDVVVSACFSSITDNSLAGYSLSPIKKVKPSFSILTFLTFNPFGDFGLHFTDDFFRFTFFSLKLILKKHLYSFFLNTNFFLISSVF